jgi:hypothetical protein
MPPGAKSHSDPLCGLGARFFCELTTVLDRPRSSNCFDVLRFKFYGAPLLQSVNQSLKGSHQTTHSGKKRPRHHSWTAGARPDRIGARQSRSATWRDLAIFSWNMASRVKMSQYGQVLSNARTIITASLKSSFAF